ncbi:MAG: ATP-dependent DNA helicase UvrD2 [Actinomycetota bacterium]|nr:ATP-dependent DNA helicase UvrD2 [Actinomycetota bacterium]
MTSPLAHRGPHGLGRSVLVEPGQRSPAEWEGCRRLVATTDSEIDELAHAWLSREPLIIEVGDIPESTPVKNDAHFWLLDPETAPPNDQINFLLTANAIDARPGRTWSAITDAIALGCTPGDGTRGEVTSPDGTPIWLDGGPLEWVPEVANVVPRLHLGIGSLAPLRPVSVPATELTPDQLAAVTHRRGPARIIAPAGSGKTRVLTERLRHLTNSGLSARAVTLVAYNVRAQHEMAERLDDVADVRVSTLHALALRVLRTAEAGKPRPDVIDELGVRRILEPLVPNLRRRVDSDALESWVDAVNSCRDSLEPPSETAHRFDQLDGLEHVVLAYRDRLRGNNQIDYPDMVLRACEALLANPSLLARVRRGVGMLLIDEFQDLTPSLMLLVRLLAGPAREVFCVGDDDQTIYGFSGATPRWLVEFNSSFPGAHHHALRINHRCPADVVTATSTLLSHNTLRIAKEIEPAAGSVSTGLTVHAPGNLAPESAMTTTIAEQLRAGTSPGQIAVLARTNAGLIASYVHLHHAGLPCRPPTGLGPDLLHRSGVAALLAWVDLATTSTLDPDSVATALQRPRRSSTPRMTEVILGIDDLDDLERFVSNNNNPKIRESLTGFCADIRRARRVVSQGATSRQIVDHLLDDLGIATMLDTLDASQRAPRRATHRDQLEAIRSIADLEPRPARLVPFIVSHLPTGADRRNTDGERITLETVHRVKGLEWPRVHIIGATDGAFPHRLNDDIEEERRIFHVAITRCSRSVDIWAGDPPSPFIDELHSSPSDTRVVPQRPARTSTVRSRTQPASTALPESDPLYQALVAWRLETARAIKKPAYTVFDNKTLAAIATAKPGDLASLAQVTGVGPAKLERWGDDVLNVMRGIDRG